MKRCVFALLALITLFASVPALAVPPQQGYIGLFGDPNHGQWCVAGSAPFYEAQVWVWILPSSRGAIGVQFKLGYPGNVVPSTLYCYDGGLGCYLSSPYNFSWAWSECALDWQWVIHQDVFVLDMTRTVVEILPYDATGAYEIATCEPGFPLEPAIRFTNLYVNYDPGDPECTGTAVESSTWGAIKSLYRE